METLEQTLRALQSEMTWRNEAWEERAERAENRMVVDLKDRLAAEQAKYHRLTMKYGMLMERYKTVKGSSNGPELPKKNFDIEPLAPPNEQIRLPKRGLFSWLKTGGKTAKH
jgi:hypothetical protein